MKTMPSEGTRESWTYGDADADGPCAGLIVGKADVKCEGLSRSVNGVDPVTTLTVISSFNSVSRRSVAISGEIDTSLVSKMADVVRGRSPSCSTVSISSVANPDREISSSVESRDRPIESKRLVVTNTGGVK